jgi:hypothetical protein
MARVEFDARDVLDRYIALLKRTGGEGPQDIAKLPAPKDVIKEVLLDVLRKAQPDLDATPIKQAFMLLATFQDLDNLASVALDEWSDRLNETSDPSMDRSSLIKAAQEKVSLRGYFDSLQERIEVERAALAEELARAGFLVAARDSG